jgi:Amt family ammonium transporter
MPPHNLAFTAIGAAMLWFGWFGFNAGNELLSNGRTSSAFTATHFAAAAGGLSWLTLEWTRRGRPNVLGLSSGVVAGLVCVTPAAGFVQPMPAIAMGATAGCICYFACTMTKNWLRYDDALDAFGIHGVGGALGAILTGVFASRVCGNINAGQPLGLLEGGNLLGPQFAAVMVTICYAGLISAIILKSIDWTVGLRVTSTDERQGLDISQHGEEGYIFL